MILVDQIKIMMNAVFMAGKTGQMKIKKDIFEIFEHDESFKYIMKRLLEASMEKSFNSVVITEAGAGYPIIYANSAFCELTSYGPHSNRQVTLHAAGSKC